MNLDKRHLIGAGLAFLGLVIWQLYLAPRPAPRQPLDAGQPGQSAPVEPSRPEAGGAAPAGAEASAPTPQAPEAQTSPAEPVVTVGATREEVVEVRTDLFQVALTNRGGRVRSWRLATYEDGEGKPIEVAASRADAELLPLALDLDDAALAKAVDNALYQVERSDLGEGKQRVQFRWADGRGLEVTKTLDFTPGDWRVGIDVDVIDRGRPVPVRLIWGPGFEAEEPRERRSSFHYAHQVVRNLGGQVVRTPARKVEGPVQEGPAALTWAGFEDQYFAVLVLPAGGQGAVRYWPVPAPGPTGEVQSRPVISVTVPPEGARLFVGPKSYRLLAGLGDQLDRVVWFSSFSALSFVARYLFFALVWVHDHVAANFGLAIVLATFVLRLVLFPLNQFAMVRMKKTGAQMQRLQPKINAIKAKYAKKKDAESRAKMNKEQMELFAREGINPMAQMSGCLPILIQMPILIAFYNVFTVAFELRGAPFVGWINDLSVKDPLYVTPVLMGLTMFLQQKLSMSKGMDPAQQRVMLAMPLIFTVMFLNMPAGLILYWLVNNILGIAQQWLVNRHTAPAAAQQKA